MSFPASVTVPEAILTSPAIASAISPCPFPDTPAMAKISPPRTVKETSRTTSNFCSFLTVRFFTSRTGSRKFGGLFSSVNSTCLPTIRSASSWIDASATFRTSISFPRRRIAQRSAIRLISAILWVIRMMVFPPLRRLSMICSRKSISWGVSTAVGSSKIMISAPR